MPPPSNNTSHQGESSALIFRVLPPLSPSRVTSCSPSNEQTTTGEIINEELLDVIGDQEGLLEEHSKHSITLKKAYELE